MLSFICRFLDFRDRPVSAYQITVPDIQDAVFIGKRRLAEDSARWPERIRRVEFTLDGEIVWTWFVPALAEIVGPLTHAVPTSRVLQN